MSAVPASPYTARRLFLSRCAGAAALGVGLGGPPRSAQSQAPVELRVSVPGPGNSVSEPLELAVKLGLDKASGLALRLRFVSGGGVALKDLESGAADFAVFGLPAAMLANAQATAAANRVVALAAIDDLPLYTLMVRTDLRDAVRSVADLRRRVVGVHSNSLATRTTSMQLADLVLRTAGVAPGEVRYVAAGQTWETQSAVMLSKTVDASMCDEPIGTRLEAAGLAQVLFSTGRPDDARSVPGAGFLRATLMARRDRVDAAPAVAARMVEMCQRLLRRLADDPLDAQADALALQGEARDAFLRVRRQFPRMYSRDGRFSAAQLEQTELFLRASNAGVAAAQAFEVDAMVDARWAGRKA